MIVNRRLQWIGMALTFALWAACVGEPEPEAPAQLQQVEPAKSAGSALETLSLNPPPGQCWYEGPRLSPNCFWTCLDGRHGETTVTPGSSTCQRACERNCGHFCMPG